LASQPPTLAEEWDTHLLRHLDTLVSYDVGIDAQLGRVVRVPQRLADGPDWRAQVAMAMEA
jgi:hypothetical protein